MTLHSARIEDVENWISQFIKGQAIIVDSKDAPYIFEKSAQLDKLRAQYERQDDGVYQLSLEAPGIASSGCVYLSSSIALPPPQWPDFFADLVMVCNLVISRMERAQDQLHRQRKQWLHNLLQTHPPEALENDGYRLGLPVGGGQVWILAWAAGTMQALQNTRKRMTAENVVLDLLKSPLLFVEEDIAVILLARQTLASPMQVRNALLTFCGAQPLWIVQGGHYHELAHLRLVLTHALALAQKARREQYSEYLLDISLFGLDSLLENPALTRELLTFADRLFAPLSAYDRTNGTNLTETLVLARTLGSAQAVSEQLDVHVNTVRYRLHRAEELLGRDQTLPKEQTATSLAAFIWLSQHTRRQSGQSHT
jgi:sugar diacid utilization regulator